MHHVEAVRTRSPIHAWNTELSQLTTELHHPNHLSGVSGARDADEVLRRQVCGLSDIGTSNANLTSVCRGAFRRLDVVLVLVNEPLTF